MKKILYIAKIKVLAKNKSIINKKIENNKYYNDIKK